MPELDEDVEPDEPTGTDADESANQEVIIDAALVRAATEEYEAGDEAEPTDEGGGGDGGS